MYFEVRKIKDFYNKIDSFISKERLPNSFGNSWLENIVDGFGFNYKEIPCRGSISYFPELGEDGIYDRIYLATETAWQPMTEMWDKIITKYYPSITYVLLAEEQGCALYINTDITGEDFPGSSTLSKSQ